MERVNRILKNDLFLEYLTKNNTAEADRRFCRHGMVHFLDVCRIGWIMNLEEELNIPKDMIYGAGLLHDIGRFQQYADKTPHEIASAELAGDILTECGYDPEEMKEILNAIRNHRNKEIAMEANLTGVLYRADKASRACYACGVSAECNWKNDKKNLEIRY